MQIAVIGGDRYKQQVLTTLLTLAWLSEAGERLVNETLQSERTLVIFDPNIIPEITPELYNAIPAYANGNDYEPLPFDFATAGEDHGPKDGNNGKSIKGLTEGVLGHELYHFLDPVSGDLLENENSKYSTGISASEVGAVEAENMIRIDFGLQPRTHYNGIEVFGKGIKKSNKYDNTYFLTNKVNYGKKISSNNKFNSDLLGVEELSGMKRGSYKYFNQWINSSSQQILYEKKK